MIFLPLVPKRSTASVSVGRNENTRGFRTVGKSLELVIFVACNTPHTAAVTMHPKNQPIRVRFIVAGGDVDDVLAAEAGTGNSVRTAFQGRKVFAATDTAARGVAFAGVKGNVLLLITVRGDGHCFCLKSIGGNFKRINSGGNRRQRSDN